MKLTVTKRISVEVDTLRMTLPMRYGDKDVPFDFPFRVGPHKQRSRHGEHDTWTVDVDLATGKIKNWPGPAARMYTKVCDEGVYVLLADGKEIARLEDYVPNDLIPGEYGDYVELEIAADGTIANWPKRPDLSAIDEGEED